MMNKQNLFLRGKQAALTTAGSLALVAAGSANAAVDISAATTGIADAQTAVLAVLAAMLTMGIAIWGVKKVLGFFRV